MESFFKGQELPLLVLVFVMLIPPAARAGPDDLIRIAEIRLEGNDFTHDEEILHYLTLEQDRSYKLDRIEHALHKVHLELEDTSYFSEVQATCELNKDREAVIIIAVKEGFTWRFGIGPGFALFGKKNLMGRGVDVTTQIGPDYQRLQYLDRWWFDTPIELNADLFRHSDRHTNVEDEDEAVDREYDSSLHRARFELGLRLSLDTTVTLGGQAEHYALDDVKVENHDLQRDFGLDGDQTILSLLMGLRWDKRDSYRLPTQGVLFNFLGEFARGRRNLDFEQLTWDLRGYVSPGRRHILAGQLLAGTTTSRTPYYRLLNLSKRRLRAPNYNEYRGTRLALLRTEYRFRLHDFTYRFWKQHFQGEIQPVLFYDVGRTWDRGEKLGFEGYMVGWGPGLRLYFSNPIQMYLRLEYGIGHEGCALYFSTLRPF